MYKYIFLYCILIGSKFWKSSKIIRAVTEADFLKREKRRNENAGASGVSRTSPLTLSDSDSDNVFDLTSRGRKRPYVPPPPDLSDSDSSVPRSKSFCHEAKIRKLFVELKEDINSLPALLF